MNQNRKMKMNLYKLIFREIKYRKINFLLSALSVIIAIAVPISLTNLIKAYEIERDKLFNSTFKEKEKMLKDAENKYRIETKKFGYNLLILPKNQNIEDFYADDYASKTMPETYVTRLANSGILTARHFLPSLKQKVHWPEGKRTIIIFGTSGEVRNVYKKPREPMMTLVKPGTAIVGYYIHKNMHLKVGDNITLFGRKFVIKKLMPEHGNKDDITVWINLKDAQQILKKPNRINAIFALQCVCSGGDINKAKKQIEDAIPDIQVLAIDMRKIKSRAEIRATAAKLTKQALSAELASRDKRIKTLRKFITIITPIIILASALWISILALLDTKEREYEIGLLIALGMKTQAILYIFLLKAFIIGLTGAILGYTLGYIFGITVGVISLNAKLLIAILIISPALSVLASLPPAISAVTAQPADILRSE